MDNSYSHDESHGDQQPTNTKAKLSDLNKNDLIQLISHLEHEVGYRDSVINDMMNQQTKQVLYQAKYGRFGAGDPFTALQRDDQMADDQFDQNQVKSLYDNQLQQLEKLIDTQRKAQAKMREQKLAADERFNKVCEELDEARRRHAHDTAQGDDVTVALEKEREKLQQDLAYERSQLKKSDKELKRTKSQLKHQSDLSAKHKQVALDLIKERRRMVSKVTEAEKKNQAIAHLLQKEQEDNKKSENSKLLQLEAKMERQLMEFDIEREQYKARLRKEENKVKDLLQQLTDIKETVLSLQQETAAEASAINDSRSTINSRPVAGGGGVDYTDSATSSGEGKKALSISLIKNLSATVSQNPAKKQIDGGTTVIAPSQAAGVQQTAKIDQGKAMSPPPKRSPPEMTGNRAPVAASHVTSPVKPVTGSPAKPILSSVLTKSVNPTTANRLANSSQPKVIVATSPQTKAAAANNVQAKLNNVVTAVEISPGRPRVTANTVLNQINNQNSQASQYIIQKSASPPAPGVSQRISAMGSPNSPRLTSTAASRTNTGNASPTSNVRQPLNCQNVRPPLNSQKSPSQPIKTVLRTPVSTLAGVNNSANIPPNRQITRTSVNNVNITPQASAKPPVTGGNVVAAVNKQNALHVSTNSVITNSRPAVTTTSPRSGNVPPHLGNASPSTVDNRVVNVANWRNSAPIGSLTLTKNNSVNTRNSRPVSTSLSSPTEKQQLSPGLSSVNKPKPPPPVRNVSLPPAKKYQPIENAS